VHHLVRRNPPALIGGTEFQHAMDCVQGCLKVSAKPERIRQAIIRLGVLLVKMNRCLVLGDRFRRSAPLHHCHAQVTVGFGVILLEANGLANFDERGVHIPFSQQHAAEIVVGPRVVLVVAKGLSKAGNSPI